MRNEIWAERDLILGMAAGLAGVSSLGPATAGSDSDVDSGSA